LSKKIKIREKRPWIGYPGSPVQQNYGEALVHGYLLWDIDNKVNFDVKFCELPNPKPFVTIEWAGNVSKTVKAAAKHPSGSRFRIRCKEVLAQKEISALTLELQQQHKATEVTFKSDHEFDRELISAGTATLAKEDLRNPDVLLKLLKDYFHDQHVTESEWEAVRNQVVHYLGRVMGADDVVRNTKWSLRHLQFDNTFAYGTGNQINFDQLPGIIGIFGPNRVGKSSIVGTIMYSLFNMTDRGSIKNLLAVNVRHPYCYTKAIISAGGSGYVIERQTVKHENRRGTQHANTHLNIFKIEEGGEVTDLAGEERKDTDRVIRKLIGSGEDALLTSVAAQDDIKQYINQGSTKRRQILSRFMDLDIFDRMYDLAKDDVNTSKASLRNLPDRDFPEAIRQLEEKRKEQTTFVADKNHEVHDIQLQLSQKQRELSSFKDVVPVTQSQVDGQKARIQSLDEKLLDVKVKIQAAHEDASQKTKKIESIDDVLGQHDLEDLKHRLENFRTLESSLESLKLLHEREAAALKQQERSLKILDDVPCGDSFPGCKFIKDAHKNKEKVEPQKEKVQRALEKVDKAQAALADLLLEDLPNKVNKLIQLVDMRSKLHVSRSSRQVELVKLEATRDELQVSLTQAQQKLVELEEALKNEENAEVVTLRHSIDELTRKLRLADTEKLRAAAEIGRIDSDIAKMTTDSDQREGLLQLMKAHELIAVAFSRRGIPNLIITSQLPVINAEVAKILHGIVDFNIELEVDNDSDSMEVYINYGDSRRPIELGSGMEKTIASIAIRVALINVSSLPKTDMFIIDEAFGPMDPASVEACNRLLMSLKRYFKNIVVITHVEGVKDVADHIIEVQKVEKDAQVVYNEAWPSDPKKKD
jgi:DNA repair exonuclease SbcCD ATPase subunit